MKICVAILAAFLLLSPALAPAAANPAGLWEGTVKAPNGDLGLAFNLHRDGDQWSAEMDVPAQGVSGVPLDKVKVDGSAISFSISAPGDPQYAGKLSQDGKTISGNLTQGGTSLTLDLKWKSEPRAVTKTPANSGEVQVLEGVWEGALDINGTPLHLRLNFTKNADGSIAGTLDSPDQKVTGLRIDGISRTADSVTIDVKTIGGSYQGTLSNDASTLTGTWTQMGNGLPLTLQRKKS
jgi:uncharacterized protein